MEHKIRSFNESGLSLFGNYLYKLTSENLTSGVSTALILDNRYSEEIDEDLYVSDIKFTNRLEAAKYLSTALNLDKNKNLYYHIGIWSWLSAFYFDQVCPISKNGKREPGENARHILEDPKNHLRYYRHLLAGPARIYAELKDLGRILLSGSISVGGEIAGQLQAYQNIGLNKGIIEAADLLYWDIPKNKLKRGSGSKGPGTPRRFVRVISQFELTYDLNAMNGSEIVSLLPSTEFGKWVKQ